MGVRKARRDEPRDTGRIDNALCGHPVGGLAYQLEPAVSTEMFAATAASDGSVEPHPREVKPLRSAGQSSFGDNRIAFEVSHRSVEEQR